MISDLKHRFNYHKPSSEVIARTHEDVRDACLQLAQYIDQEVPDSREKTLAITKLEEAMFWANAAIARVSNYQGDRREP